MEYFCDINKCNRYIRLYYKKTYIQEPEYTKYEYIKLSNPDIYGNISTTITHRWTLGMKIHNRKGPALIGYIELSNNQLIEIASLYYIYGKEYDYCRWLKYLAVTTKYSNKK